MFIFGAVFLALAPSPELVAVGRIIMGIAIGIACYITPLYLSEISPPRIRGGMIGLYQFMINVGLLVIFLTDTFFAQFAAWRWMFAIVAIPAALMLFLVFRLPRSPRWLFLRDNAVRATEILTKLLPKEEAKQTIEQIRATLHKPRFNLRECLSGKNRFFTLVLLGAGVMFFQQWTGIDAILYYATDIYRMAGFKTISAQMWCAIAFAAFNCLSTIIFIKFIIDRLGRRKSLFISFTIMAVALFVCGYVIKVKPETEFLRLAGLISTFVYILGFGISLGPVAWIICSEIFPLQVRETGVMLTTMSNWIFNLILMQIFPIIVGYGALWMFAIISLFGIIYVYFLIPETKGVPLETIEENLRQRKPLAQLNLPIKKLL